MYSSTDIANLQAQAKELAAGWNVDWNIVFAAMLDSGGAITGGNVAQIRGIDEPYFSRKDHSSAATEFTFFDENISQFKTNMANGQIDAQTVFALENIGVELHLGYDRTNTAGSTAAPAFSGTSLAGAAAAEAKRKAFMQGYFELRRGQEVLFSCVGLDKLPIGGGLDAAVSIAATAGAAVHTTNGAPFAGNKRPFGRGRTLLAGGDGLRAKIILPAVADPGTNVSAHWEVCLFGRKYRRK